LGRLAPIRPNPELHPRGPKLFYARSTPSVSRDPHVIPRRARCRMGPTWRSLTHARAQCSRDRVNKSLCRCFGEPTCQILPQQTHPRFLHDWRDADSSAGDLGVARSCAWTGSRVLKYRVIGARAYPLSSTRPLAPTIAVRKTEVRRGRSYQFAVDRTLGAISTGFFRSGKVGRVRIALDWPPASTNFIADTADPPCAVGGLPRCFDWRYGTSSNASRCTNFILWVVELVAMHRGGTDSTITGELRYRGCTSLPRSGI
jgi:hypothetical protein